jgi:flagellar basal-body rod protein FlgC
MNFFDMMNVSASALTAQRARIETIASNLANSSTTRTAEGTPYRRRDVIFQAASVRPFKSELDVALMGVSVSEIVEDQTPFRVRFEPGHPDANGQGMVEYPNVEPVTEMVNMVSATRSYEANLAVIEATKSLMLNTLQI